MADVFTIDDLNALAALTAADEVPVWDSEESGEPTKKITAQNMTASVKTLGNLVNTSEMNSALAGKQNTLTFDATPTTGSTNPVTSDGIKTAIAQSTASLGDPITVAHGGRGMSTASINVTSSYTTLASAINSIRSTVAFPISFIKVASHTISDLPSGKTTKEFSGICFGDSDRMQVLLFIFADTDRPYYRQLFKGNWINDWVQL